VADRNEYLHFHSKSLLDAEISIDRDYLAIDKDRVRWSRRVLLSVARSGHQQDGRNREEPEPHGTLQASVITDASTAVTGPGSSRLCGVLECVRNTRSLENALRKQPKLVPKDTLFTRDNGAAELAPAALSINTAVYAV